MAQTSYTQNMARGLEGQLADISNHNVETRRALEKIPFGRAVVRGNAAPGKDVRLPMINRVTLAASIELVAANSTVCTVNVTTIDANGDRTTTSTTIAAEVYATSHAATMAALAVKIDAVAGVASATVNGSDDNKIDIVAASDTEVTISALATTGGAGQPTWTATDTSADAFAGVALHKPNTEQDANGVAQYTVGRAVNVLTAGTVYVYAEAAITGGDDVYTRYKVGAAGTKQGRFLKTADTSKAFQLTRARFPEDIASGAIGPVQINLP